MGGGMSARVEFNCTADGNNTRSRTVALAAMDPVAAGRFLPSRNHSKTTAPLPPNTRLICLCFRKYAIITPFMVFAFFPWKALEGGFLNVVNFLGKFQAENSREMNNVQNIHLIFSPNALAVQISFLKQDLQLFRLKLSPELPNFQMVH